jgi:hypothetical protein
VLGVGRGARFGWGGGRGGVMGAGLLVFVSWGMCEGAECVARCAGRGLRAAPPACMAADSPPPPPLAVPPAPQYRWLPCVAALKESAYKK